MRPFLQTFILLGLITLPSVILNAQWIQTNGPYLGLIHCFAVSGTNLFAGTVGGGVFLSSNNGTSWTAVNSGLTNSYVFALATSGTNLFAGTDGGVFLSTNNGTSWSAVNSGLTYSDVYALATSGTNLFAGTYGGGVWRRPLSEFVTSVEETARQLPEIYALAQNYPNPFNPSTRISFSITKEGPVSLQVYDVLGREVATLVNENRKAGQYTEQFNGNQTASGVYMYVLRSSEGQLVGRMMLLK